MWVLPKVGSWILFSNLFKVFFSTIFVILLAYDLIFGVNFYWKFDDRDYEYADVKDKVALLVVSGGSYFKS